MPKLTKPIATLAAVAAIGGGIAAESGSDKPSEQAKMEQIAHQVGGTLAPNEVELTPVPDNSANEALEPKEPQPYTAMEGSPQSSHSYKVFYPGVSEGFQTGSQAEITGQSFDPDDPTKIKDTLTGKEIGQAFADSEAQKQANVAPPRIAGPNS